MEILSENILLILTVGILAGSVIVGVVRGFIKTFFAAFSVLIALIIAAQLGPYVGKVIQHTPIYTGIAVQIEENMDEQTDGIADRVVDQIDTIAGFQIPGFIKDALIENNNSQMYDALGVYDFNEYVAAYMACLVINAASFLIVFLTAYILIKMIEGALNLISKLPVLHSINKMGGLICGLVHGLIIIWLIGVVIMALAWTVPGQWASAQINENPILGLIYNNNAIVLILTNMGKLLF
jgi:uncharacterized membrane protein required for colicin V production